MWQHLYNPEHRAHIAKVWGCDEAEIPGKGIPAQEIIEAIGLLAAGVYSIVRLFL